MKKASELRDLSADELKAQYVETRKELFHLKNDWQRSKKMENPHLLRQKRKDIARMLTIATEKTN